MTPELPDVRLRTPVAHPLCADLEERAIGKPFGPDASADPVAGFEHDYRAARLVQAVGRSLS